MEEGESDAEKAARYRKLAEKVEALAAACTNERDREQYLKVAKDWRMLAERVERR